MSCRLLLAALAAWIVLAPGPGAVAAPDPGRPDTPDPAGVVRQLLPSLPPLVPTVAPGLPVRIDGRTLMRIGNAPDLTAAERAELIERRMTAMIAAPQMPALVVDAGPARTAILVDGHPLVSVHPDDVALNGARSPRDLAATWRDAVEATVETAQRERSAHYIMLALLGGLVSTLLAWLTWAATNGLSQRIRAALDAGAAGFPRLFGQLERVPHFHGVDIRPALQTLNQLGLLASRLVVINAWLLVVLGLFPQTRSFNDLLLRSLLAAIGTVGQSLLGYVPNLVTILVTLVATQYLIKMTRFLFRQMAARPEELGFGLPLELIDALGKLATVVLWVFGAMVIAPLLPGLGTQTGQVIGLIVGAMITLGSGSTVGNAVAGFVLAYMRPFHVGDRVRVGDHEGDVIERNFTDVRLRTSKNEVITLTSNQVLGSPIVNYSTVMSQGRCLILHAAITLGYDVVRSQAEELLLEAARRTEGALADPPPFVWVTGLGDFSIGYQINIYTSLPNAKGTIASNLNKNVLDVFAEAGVEILSPNYLAVRDGNRPTVGAAHGLPGSEDRAGGP